MDKINQLNKIADKKRAKYENPHEKIHSDLNEKLHRSNIFVPWECSPHGEN